MLLRDEEQVFSSKVAISPNSELLAVLQSEGSFLSRVDDGSVAHSVTLGWHQPPTIFSRWTIPDLWWRRKQFE